MCNRYIVDTNTMLRLLEFTINVKNIHQRNKSSRNIRFSIGSNSRPGSSRNHKAADQATAIDRYQSHFRKPDIFFSGKQQGAIKNDRKIYCLLYHFGMVLMIFEVATSLSIFSTTGPLLVRSYRPG